MSAKVTIQYNSDGFRQILNSPDVANLVGQQARSIAARAGEGFEVDGPRSMNYGGGRIGAFVSAKTREARESEATDKTLTRAVGSGV